MEPGRKVPRLFSCRAKDEIRKALLHEDRDGAIRAVRCQMGQPPVRGNTMWRIAVVSG